MIQALKGIVQAKKKQAILLGIGPVTLDIMIADASFFTLDTSYTILTYLHWTQEQGPFLYGFKEELDRAVFLLVIGCSGIGPRLGLAVLADLGASQFIHAIRTGDERMLSKINGIGAKKAEQIIVQLKHKIHDFLASDIAVKEDKSQIDWHTISDALHALNYSRGEISQAITFIRGKNHEGSASFDQLLRQALSFLSKQQ